MFIRLNANPKQSGLQWASVILLQLACILVFAVASHADSIEDKEVTAFFDRLQKSFLERNFSGVVQSLHKDFSYIMTYVTDGKFSYLESDAKDYRKNVGAFFISKPEIYEYAITVENIERMDKDILVLIRTRSVVELYNIINTCEAMSNYHLRYIDNDLVVKDVRGDATCFNTTGS